MALPYTQHLFKTLVDIILITH